MFDIYLNDEKFDFELDNEKCLGDVIDEIGDWLHENSYWVITRVILNNKEPIDIDSDVVYSIELDKKIEKISIYAEDTEYLIVDSINECLKYLPKMREAVTLKERLVENLALIADGLSWICGVINNIQFIKKLDFSKIYAGNSTLSEVLERFREILNQINKHLLNNDLRNIEKLCTEELVLIIDKVYVGVNSLKREVSRKYN